MRWLIAVSLGTILILSACQTGTNRSESKPNAVAIGAGKAAFYDAACWRCHSLGDEELPGNPDFENQGPDLMFVGDRLNGDAILQSIIHPNKTIAEPAKDHSDPAGNSKMPSFADTLSPDAIENIVLYLSTNRLPTERSGAIDVTTETFDAEVLQADILVLLDFWAEWCVPCHEIDPVLEKLAPEYRGRVKICRINVDDNPDLVADYVPDNIFPCLILMKNGQLLDRQYGTDPTMAIEPFFRKWFSGYQVEAR